MLLKMRRRVLAGFHLLTRPFKRSHSDTQPRCYQVPVQKGGGNATAHALAIHLHPGNAAHATVSILHLDRGACFPVPIAETETLPKFKNYISEIFPFQKPTLLKYPKRSQTVKNHKNNVLGVGTHFAFSANS
jgi:hypothetical protein